MMAICARMTRRAIPPLFVLAEPFCGLCSKLQVQIGIVAVDASYFGRKRNRTIVFSSSIDGDYFSGAPGSTLLIDEVSLVCLNQDEL